MSDDFFGHNLRYSSRAVSLDVNEVMGQSKQKSPYVDLSDEPYVSVNATETIEPDNDASAEHDYLPDFGQQISQRINKGCLELASTLAYGLGGFVFVWLIGNLAIASRSGELDQVRVYHLSAANRSLPVLALLGGGAVVGIKKKIEDL